MKIEEIRSTVSENGKDPKICIHSHIKGLGLNEDGTANAALAGFIGQAEAREVSFQLYFARLISFIGANRLRELPSI